MNNFSIGADQLDLLNDFGGDASFSNPSASENEELISSEKKSERNTSYKSKAFPEMLLIVDTETTGLDAQIDKCIEVGAILFSVPNRATIAQISFLLPSSSNKAESINRIPFKLTNLKQPLNEALNYFQALIDSADIFVAHNAAFDSQWFGKEHLPCVNKPWLCSMEDINWPDDRNLRARPSVRDLALAYEVPVWNAHRALSDCIYLAEVFKRCSDLEKLLSEGLEPRRLMKAQISYDQRHLAREAGFRWNDPISGSWSRRLSDREVSKLKFPVIPIELDC